MSAVLSFLRDADWLHARRARAYAVIMAIAIGLTLIFAWVTLVLGHPPFMAAHNHGMPGDTDFLSFWSAGKLALSGAPGAPYFDQGKLAAQERLGAYMKEGVSLAFFYPPVFVMFCMPFALLPYLPGFVAFTASQSLLMLAALRRLVPAGWGVLPLISFPGLLVNAAVGQNGFFSAAAFAAAALYLDRAPAAAGLALGFLVFKPHLAFAVPVALLAARRWVALFVCGGTALGLMVLSAAVLGVESWQGFIACSKVTVSALEVHREDWARLVSVHTAVRELGVPLAGAYVAQGITILAALGVLALYAARRPDGQMLAALMVGATMLIPPHLLDYDLAMAAVPLLVVAQCAMRSGWLPWEKIILAGMWLLPLVGRLLTDMNIPVGPPILIGTFAVVCRRAAMQTAKA